MDNFAAGLIVGLTIGAVIVMCNMADMQQQVVEHHAAQYNETTGEIEWLDCHITNVH